MGSDGMLKALWSDDMDGLTTVEYALIICVDCRSRRFCVDGIRWEGGGRRNATAQKAST